MNPRLDDNTPYHNQPLRCLLAYLQQQNYRFCAISPASHAIVNARNRQAHAHSLTDIFGWNRPFKPDQIDASLFSLMQAAKIAVPVDHGGYKSLLRVASVNDQLYLHSAYPTVENSAVFFGPDSYRFAHAIQHFLAANTQPIRRAIDIGTGSGLGAILLANALPACDIIASDINSEALALARINSAVQDIDTIRMINSNLLNEIEGQFDLIIANPPYLNDAATREYRHGGGRLGDALSLAIVDAAIARLNPNGALMLYTGVAIEHGHDAFLAAASQTLTAAGYTYDYTEIDPDIFGEELMTEAYGQADRIAAVVLTARKPASIRAS